MRAVPFLATVLGLVVPLMGLALAAPVAQAAPRPPGGNFQNPVVRAVDIAEPAVVRIATEEDARISIRLCTRTATLPLDGSTYQIGVSGSGAFITSNGDILTADHVVDIPDDLIVEFAAQDIADLLNNASAVDPGCRASGFITADAVAAGDVNFGYNTQRANVHTFAWLSTAYTGPLAASAMRDVPQLDATKLATSTFTENDLALLHVNMSDTPSVRLDDSSAVAVEDRLTVVGFPGNGDVNDNPSNFLTPSVNEVLVSAIKAGDNGTQLIQVGGNVEHGDSGGPVLDGDGHIVGVVSFGGPDPRGNTTFLRTSNAALDLVQTQGLNLAPGPFQQAWAKAFGDYAATYPGHWQAAARAMTQLASAYPHFIALTPYLDYAKTAAAQEQAQLSAKQPSGIAALPLWLLFAGGGGIALLLSVGVGLGVWLLIRRRRRRAAPAPVAVYPYAGYTAHPGFAAPSTYPLPGGGYPAQGTPGYVSPSPDFSSGPYAPLPPSAPLGARVASDPRWPSASGGGSSSPIFSPAYGSIYPPTDGNGSATQAATPSLGSESAAVAAPSPGQPSAAMVLCAHGHWFAASDPRCPWCGAPRAPATVPGSAFGTTPWGQ